MASIRRVISGLGLSILVASANIPAWAADMPPNPAIPVFTTGDSSGWELDRSFGVDDLLAPPGGGPGPVTFEKSHPYLPNSTRHPTYRVADLSNPILQEWLKPSMKKANDDVLAGQIPFRAHERCWPAGVPAIDADAVGEPMFIYQGPEEIVVVMKSGPEIRHIYLNVSHSQEVAPSWYGESVGHYEGGDTLVIDTVGLNDRTFVDNYRTPHTTRMHVIERWKLAADGKTIDVSILVDDPGAFTMPWQAVQRWRRVQLPYEENICAENNINYGNLDAKLVPIPQSASPDF